jgi:hypothetical protein
MKKQITTIQKYFKDKLLSGEYEISILNSEHVIELTIDNEFKFTIWISNSGFEQYISSYFNFIVLQEFTKEEVLTARIKLDPRLKKLEEEIKETKIQELQNQIQKLKS